MKKVVWIVGASEGIGLALVKLYLQNGDRVVASARNTEASQNLNELKKSYTSELSLVDIDVRSEQSVSEATDEVCRLYGGIDLCIYNAGVYESMRIESWDLAHLNAMNDVNYLGAVRLLHALVPHFMAQGVGHVVFNASISSYFGLPYGGGYSAPKAALLNLCESLYPELQSKNIKLQVINHGFVKTRLTAKNKFSMPQLLEPEVAAEKIFAGITKSVSFEIKFPFLLSSFLHLLRLLPYKIAFAVTKRAL